MCREGGGLGRNNSSPNTLALALVLHASRHSGSVDSRRVSHWPEPKRGGGGGDSHCFLFLFFFFFAIFLTFSGSRTTMNNN